MARLALRPSRGWSRYAAPVAFLAAATIAVLLVRSALNHGTSQPTAPATTATRPATKATTTKAKTTSTSVVAPRYYIVQAGDTFSKIAAREGTTVAAIEQLNPGVASTALHVGQKIRVG